MRLEPMARETNGPDSHLADEPWRGTVAGGVAALVSLGFGELVASLGTTMPSLVVGVGSWLIDRSPGAVSRTAISLLGANNKPALVTGIVAVCTVLAAALGRASIERRTVGVVGFVLFAALGAVASAGEPGATTTGVLTVAVLAAGVGSATLLGLLLVAEGRLAIAPGGLDHPTDPHASRRAFLGFAGAAGSFAGLTAVGARRLAARSPVEEARAGIVLPTTTTPPTLPEVPGSSSTVPAPIEVDGITPLHTPNDSFFRIDTALAVPQVDPSTWSLTVYGFVDSPFTVTYDELQQLPLVEQDVTLACVSNEVGGHLVGTARWLGVPLADLLDRAGVQPAASQVVGHSVDGFTAGFPLQVLDGERPALVAIGMNGDPLPLRHGFPARLVVSGLYGYVSATKWLERIEVTTWEDFDGYWIRRGWAKEGPVHTQARIDVPRPGGLLEPGRVPIAGVAWAPSRGIAHVEVQIDDGEWTDAEVGTPLGDHAWRQWVLPWDAESGEHVIRVRATDGTGRVQTAERRPPAPSGATGHHEVHVEVR